MRLHAISDHKEFLATPHNPLLFARALMPKRREPEGIDLWALEYPMPQIDKEFSDAAVEWFVDAREAGFKYSDIARLAGVASNRVNNAVISARPDMRRRESVDIDWDQVKRMRDKGVAMQDIAEILDVHKSVLSRGWAAHIDRPRIDWPAVEEALKTRSVADTARMFGISPHTIYKYRQRQAG